MQTRLNPSHLATSTVGPAGRTFDSKFRAHRIENQWFPLTGRVVALKVEADGDLYIALQDTTGDKPGIYELAQPSFARLISGGGPLKRIVNVRHSFKNIINCDCLHAKIVAAYRLPVVVGVHARTARNAGPQGGRVRRSCGK